MFDTGNYKSRAGRLFRAVTPPDRSPRSFCWPPRFLRWRSFSSWTPGPRRAVRRNRLVPHY